MPRGVRLNPEHDERTRAKIQTSQIINRLNSFVNGEVELTTAQVTAALGLLKKTLPDLASITHEGGDTPIGVQVLSSKPMTAEEWAKQFAPKTSE